MFLRAGPRPGIRRWGLGGRNTRRSRWRAKRTLTVVGSANRWSGWRDGGRNGPRRRGRAGGFSREAGISEASVGVVAEGGFPRTGNRPRGHFPRSGNGWSGGGCCCCGRGALVGRSEVEPEKFGRRSRDGALIRSLENPNDAGGTLQRRVFSLPCPTGDPDSSGNG